MGRSYVMSIACVSIAWEVAVWFKIVPSVQLVKCAALGGHDHISEGIR